MTGGVTGRTGRRLESLGGRPGGDTCFHPGKRG